MRIPTALFVAAMACLAISELPAAADDKDVITRKSGAPAKGYVTREASDMVVYFTNKDLTGTAQVIRMTDVKNIEYAFMRNEGFWTRAQEAKSRGRYEEAAEVFESQAANAAREGEKVYGAFEAGNCWELAQRYDLAAKAFAIVGDGFGPKNAAPTGTSAKVNPADLAHRLWSDARMRQGMNLALAKDEAGAKAVADTLEARAKTGLQTGLDARAAAIRAAIAALQKDKDRFQNETKRAVFANEGSTELYFQLWTADRYRDLGEPGKSARLYDNILKLHSGGNPALIAQARHGQGMSLMETEPDKALLEFLVLDVMPFGSPDQKCEARYHGGRIMLNQARRLRASPSADPTKAAAQIATADELERAARLLLVAASEADSKLEARALAVTLLEGIAPAASAGSSTASTTSPPAPGGSATATPTPSGPRAPALSTPNPATPNPTGPRPPTLAPPAGSSARPVNRPQAGP